ncbi:MAG TPA: hypothetical protein ENI99_01180 [Sedimenticola sp.]|nr:hypothetical protein [Sedimenticola sp.]
MALTAVEKAASINVAPKPAMHLFMELIPLKQANGRVFERPRVNGWEIALRKRGRVDQPVPAGPGHDFFLLPLPWPVRTIVSACFVRCQLRKPTKAPGREQKAYSVIAPLVAWAGGE